MSKTYELIMASLNEILKDLQETGGENLKREILAAEISTPAICKDKTCASELEKFSR